MKKVDTAALRERLSDYTPEQEIEENKQVLEGMAETAKGQVKDFSELVEEIKKLVAVLTDIKQDLSIAIKQETEARTALEAAVKSADNIVNGISNAIVKAEQNTVIPAKVSTEELGKIGQCTDRHIEKEEALLKSHTDKMAKLLRGNEGIWFSNRWLATLVVVNTISYLAIVLWAFMK